MGYYLHREPARQHRQNSLYRILSARAEDECWPARNHRFCADLALLLVHSCSIPTAAAASHRCRKERVARRTAEPHPP